jgi:hypothetical protein
MTSQYLFLQAIVLGHVLCWYAPFYFKALQICFQ